MQDRYEKIGAPNTDADDETVNPIGTAEVPAENARICYFPLGGGLPPTSGVWDLVDGASPSAPTLLVVTGGTTVTAPSEDESSIRASISEDTGVWYFEYAIPVMPVTPAALNIGVVKADAVIEDDPFTMATDSLIVLNGVGNILDADGAVVGTSDAPTAGSIVGVLFEPGTGVQFNLNGGAFSTAVPLDTGDWAPFVSLSEGASVTMLLSDNVAYPEVAEAADATVLGDTAPPIPPVAPGAWDPADVQMRVGAGYTSAFTFTESNARISNPDEGLGDCAAGTCRTTTNKTSGKKYIELVMNAHGLGFNALGFGFISTSDPYNQAWTDAGNNNITWRPGNGGVYHDGVVGPSFPDPSMNISALPPGTVLGLGIEIGVGLTFASINGGTPIDVSPSAIGFGFTEADVKFFISIASFSGKPDDGTDATVLTTAATQQNPPFAGHTPWDS